MDLNWVIGGGIVTFLGIVFTLTLIGAILGIPLIILGLIFLIVGFVRKKSKI